MKLLLAIICLFMISCESVNDVKESHETSQKVTFDEYLVKSIENSDTLKVTIVRLNDGFFFENFPVIRCENRSSIVSGDTIRLATYEFISKKKSTSQLTLDVEDLRQIFCK